MTAREKKRGVFGTAQESTSSEPTIVVPEHERKCAAFPQVGQETLRVWFGEAQRIASEYRRSHSVRDLRAFCRQIIGIMQEVERALPR